ncbi:MAG: peroxidase-related enzyme [Rhodobacteraceae bacterium]|nr:peroxidase-related enzyme [Paracoccaceae bacterium]
MSSWIKMVSDEDADENLAAALDLARTPHGTVDNVMRVHSLRPETMRGHMELYRSILHNDATKVPKWFLETVGSYVSLLNSCEYSYSNHWKNAQTLIGDGDLSLRIEESFKSGDFSAVFSERQAAMLEYAGKLTLEPGNMQRRDVTRLQKLGWEDVEILEVNQVACYFSYANRLLNGLGVSTQGDTIGYYADA